MAQAYIPNLSIIKLPSGDQYYVKDAAGRLMIANTYQTSTKYDPNTLIIYQSEGTNQLYRITSSITAANNTGWAAMTEHVTPTSIDKEIERLEGLIAGGINFRGKIIESLVDGAATPTTVHLVDQPSVAYTPKNGDMFLCRKSENIPDPDDYSGAFDLEFVAYVNTSTGALISWNELGSSSRLKALAFKDSASGTYKKPTGSGSVSVPTITPTTKYLNPVEAVTAVAPKSSTGTFTALTGLGTASTDTFVKSYPGSTKKLATTTIYEAGANVTIPNVTGNSEVTVPVVSSNGTVSASLVETDGTWPTATVGTAVTVGTGLTAAGNSNVLNGASYNAENERLDLSSSTLASTSVTPAASSPITKYKITGVTATNTVFGTATKASKVTLGDAITAGGARAAKTVATGSLADSDTSGGTILVGLGTPTTTSAVTGYPNPTTNTAIHELDITKAAAVTTQAAAGTGTIGYTEGVTVGSKSANVTVGITDATVTVS